jgi:signal-transduction protein with cAMP-binding, CBS, and nucleotidyltransferase domain
LKAMDMEFYHALVIDTDWERHFKLEWRKKGDIIIRINEPPNGLYYLDSGSVNALDEKGEVITTLVAGNVFGEMAYFSKKKRRNATVVANTDVVVRRISNEKFDSLPVIKKIFKRIALKRKRKAP